MGRKPSNNSHAPSCPGPARKPLGGKVAGIHRIPALFQESVEASSSIVPRVKRRKGIAAPARRVTRHCRSIAPLPGRGTSPFRNGSTSWNVHVVEQIVAVLIIRRVATEDRREAEYGRDSRQPGRDLPDQPWYGESRRGDGLQLNWTLIWRAGGCQSGHGFERHRRPLIGPTGRPGLLVRLRHLSPKPHDHVQYRRRGRIAPHVGNEGRRPMGLCRARRREGHGSEGDRWQPWIGRGGRVRDPRIVGHRRPLIRRTSPKLHVQQRQRNRIVALVGNDGRRPMEPPRIGRQRNGCEHERIVRPTRRIGVVE